MSDLARLACLLCAALCLPGCVPLLTAMGSGSSVIAVAAQAERIKLAADALSYAKSKKTLTDHGLSALMDADCTLFNAITPDPVCTPKNDVDMAHAQDEEANVIVAAAPREELKAAPVALAAALPTTLPAAAMTSPVRLTAIPLQASDNAGGD